MDTRRSALYNPQVSPAAGAVPGWSNASIPLRSFFPSPRTTSIVESPTRDRVSSRKHHLHHPHPPGKPWNSSHLALLRDSRAKISSSISDCANSSVSSLLSLEQEQNNENHPLPVLIYPQPNDRPAPKLSGSPSSSIHTTPLSNTTPSSNTVTPATSNRSPHLSLSARKDVPWFSSDDDPFREPPTRVDPYAQRRELPTTASGSSATRPNPYTRTVTSRALGDHLPQVHQQVYLGDDGAGTVHLLTRRHQGLQAHGNDPALYNVTEFSTPRRKSTTHPHRSGVATLSPSRTRGLHATPSRRSVSYADHDTPSRRSAAQHRAASAVQPSLLQHIPEREVSSLPHNRGTSIFTAPPAYTTPQDISLDDVGSQHPDIELLLASRDLLNETNNLLVRILHLQRAASDPLSTSAPLSRHRGTTSRPKSINKGQLIRDEGFVNFSRPNPTFANEEGTAFKLGEITPFLLRSNGSQTKMTAAWMNSAMPSRSNAVTLQPQAETRRENRGWKHWLGFKWIRPARLRRVPATLEPVLADEHTPSIHHSTCSNLMGVVPSSTHAQVSSSPTAMFSLFNQPQTHPAFASQEVSDNERTLDNSRDPDTQSTPGDIPLPEHHVSSTPGGGCERTPPVNEPSRRTDLTFEGVDHPRNRHRRPRNRTCYQCLGCHKSLCKAGFLDFTSECLDCLGLVHPECPHPPRPCPHVEPQPF